MLPSELARQADDVVVLYDTYDLEVGFLLALDVIWRLVLLISPLFHYQLYQCIITFD